MCLEECKVMKARFAASESGEQEAVFTIYLPISD